MIKSKTNSVTLAGAYLAVTDATIPLFKSLQFVNSTGGNVTVKFNSDSTARTYADGDIFYKTTEYPNESCGDVIYANGTGTILIEIEYYS